MRAIEAAPPVRQAHKWREALGVFVASMVASAAVAFVYVASARRDDQALLATQGSAVSVTIDAIVSDAGDQAKSVAALFHASEEVTDAEFTRFVGDIGLTDGMFGLGFIASVGPVGLASFEETLQTYHPDAFLFEVEGMDQVPVGSRSMYYPIQFFYSDEEFPAWGFDAYTQYDFRTAIDRITETGSPTSTGFFTFPGRPGVDGWVMFEPAFRDDGTLVGMVATAMDLGDVLSAALPPGVEGRVEFAITDTFSPSPPTPEGAWSDFIKAADRTWRLDVVPVAPSSHLGLGLGLFGAGMVISLALGFATFAFVARRMQQREMDELRLLDRQKDDFLATVSHELRTPLTSIVGFADSLRDISLSYADSERAEMLEYISDEAREMEGIVQDLLVAARLQQGGAIPINTAVMDDLAVAVTRIADQFAAVRSTPTTVHGNASVAADPARVYQILRNLFDNAVRHGQPPIEVTISTRNGTTSAVISDSGSGISIEDTPDLFSRYRSGPNPDGLPTSTGIGLWLSRELARLMDGDLRLIESDAGAAFELTLPSADDARRVA